MTARLFVCTTCDRYAPAAGSPTRGEAMLLAVRQEAARRGVGHLVSGVACVLSCPRPNGAAVRESGGGFRFARLNEADAPALIDFLAGRAAGEPADVPQGLADRVACYILPRS